MYIAGIDGGGTSTCCVIGDEKGNVLSEGTGAPSNYQVIGIDAARSSVWNSLSEAMVKINIDLGRLDYVYLGLAGADIEPDFKVLNEMCKQMLGNVPFKVVNDCWVGLRAGIPENYGIVTICGTGTNTAGRTRDGREVILRSMSYELGNRGGGIDVSRDALHHAYRSEEGTGPKTRLETVLPEILGFKSLADMVEPVRMGQADCARMYKIPPAVFELASEGDRVCQDILVSMGRTIGELATGVIKKLGLEKEEIPVTLVGGLTKGRNPLLVDEYITTVHRAAPYAHISISKLEPVMGAYLLGLEAVGA
jgi:N-acetylglucosamine kinase-like BadF-type ATPase